MRVNSTIFIDFDGTLVDVSDRSYKVYCYYVSKYLKEKTFPKEVYWCKRRSGCKFVEFLETKHNICDIKLAKKEYLRLIENRSFLKLDFKFRGIISILKQFKKKHNLVLISLRRKKNNLNWQLGYLKLKQYFDEIISSSNDVSVINAKCKLIKKSRFYKKKNRNFIIGDTEIDILSGKKTGCCTIAVCSGIRSKKYLNSFSPDYIFNNISKVKRII